jgi:hypothetical protein
MNIVGIPNTDETTIDLYLDEVNFLHVGTMQIKISAPIDNYEEFIKKNNLPDEDSSRGQWADYLNKGCATLFQLELKDDVLFDILAGDIVELPDDE